MTPRKLWTLVRVAATFGFLCGVWLLFSADNGWLSILAGASCAALIALASYDTFIDEHEAGKNMVFPRLLPALAYPARLVAAMYSSSFATLRTLMTGSAAPRVVHFRTRLKSDLARVVLAEAITFTPGTIVIDLDEDHLIVHWLNSTTRHSRRAGETVKGRLESIIGGMWV
ncbi:MAG TPA: Na+/H+ antiporter subunit E [Spirochaetales bacterium]|nr:Na+/H+ antiporter subunit E [Spirochaetales bacterium]HPG85478.1 Na+/H+ antiporter subunit E [Spirochaetales bacterium]HPM72441.1 Na+/H+ antiporter subunit E [Spirochaetales bacterium]